MLQNCISVSPPGEGTSAVAHLGSVRSEVFTLPRSRCLHRPPVALMSVGIEQNLDLKQSILFGDLFVLCYIQHVGILPPFAFKDLASPST